MDSVTASANLEYRQFPTSTAVFHIEEERAVSLESEISNSHHALHIRETELAEARREIRFLKSRGEKLHQLATLGTLVAGVAHEIKNPLNFVNNFATLSKGLLEELDKINLSENGETNSRIAEIVAELRQSNEFINEHGNRAAQIVSDMMSMARGDRTDQVPTPLNDLVREYTKLTLQDRRLRNQEAAVNIGFDLDPEAGSPAISRHSIGRVIINLVSNAIDALTRDGKEGLSSGQPTIQIRTRAMEEKVEIEIEDNGGGIPNEDISRIFDSFYTTKKCGNGNIGLGLAISRAIVEKEHSGTLRVDSREGVTRFVIGLPH